MDTKIQTPIYFLFSGSFLPNNGMSMIKAIEINKAFHEKHGERVDVGLHWDHWTESLPEMYGLN